MSGSGLGRLQRLASPASGPTPAGPASDEVCEFCGAGIGERHGHVADVTEHRLLCACRPCYLLFEQRGAGGGRFRGVGEEVRRVIDLHLDEGAWNALQVPVDLVFFFRQAGPGDDPDRLLGFYPGPGGATESELDLGAWGRILADNPVLDDIAADVEAVLLRRSDGGFTAHLVPIDTCYELVGLVRAWWQGLGGGTEVWRQLATWFDELDRRGTDVPSTGAA